MSTIIIGNGTSLLEKNNGDLIDSFADVVRFNAYTIKGFEKHVGTKTTIWYNTINFPNKSEQWRTIAPYKKVVLHSWQWDGEKDILFKDFSEFKNKENCKFDVLEKTQRSSIIEIQEYTNNKIYFPYSTGAIALWDMLKYSDHIVITGFDWWDTSKHHYNDSAPRGEIHQPKDEKIFINKLVDEDKVSFLLG